MLSVWMNEVTCSILIQKLSQKKIGNHYVVWGSVDQYIYQLQKDEKYDETKSKEFLSYTIRNINDGEVIKYCPANKCGICFPRDFFMLS